jgi:hypothetical protein
MKPQLPDSNTFWIVAKGYLTVADAAFQLTESAPGDNGELPTPTAFLYFRAIELSLKAALASHNIPETEITKTLGHRLTQLSERIKQVRSPGELPSLDKFDPLITSYSDYYSNKWFEYPDKIWNLALPDLETLRTSAHEIVDDIRFYKFG